MRPIDADAVLDRYYAEYERQDICDGAEDREWLMKCLNEAPTLTPPNEPRAGLYGKYTVYKNKDGSLVTDCFILRPAKDPAAVAALRAYATATDNAELSADIINWIGAEPNEWVSVEERLPEHLKDVLALYGNGKIDIDWVDSSGDFKFGSLFDGVTHWMPLPAPPDKEQTT